MPHLTLKNEACENDLLPFSIDIWSWKKALTLTYTLFLNAQQTFPPVKYPYCLTHCLLSSIRHPRRLYDVEEIYVIC